MDNDYLPYIEERLAAVEGLDPQFRNLLIGNVDDQSVQFTATRDLERASLEDSIFIANALRDLRSLVRHLQGGALLGNDALLEIEWRVIKSSPGFWIAHLDDDHTGGCDIISLHDERDPRDLYLSINGREAPSRLYEEIAMAHQAIPALLQWIRARDRVTNRNAS